MLTHRQINILSTPTHNQGVCHQRQSVIRSVVVCMCHVHVIAIDLFYAGICIQCRALSRDPLAVFTTLIFKGMYTSSVI